MRKRSKRPCLEIGRERSLLLFHAPGAFKCPAVMIARPGIRAAMKRPKGVRVARDRDSRDFGRKSVAPTYLVKNIDLESRVARARFLLLSPLEGGRTHGAHVRRETCSAQRAAASKGLFTAASRDLSVRHDVPLMIDLHRFLPRRLQVRAHVAFNVSPRCLATYRMRRASIGTGKIPLSERCSRFAKRQVSRRKSISILPNAGRVHIYIYISLSL